MLVFQKSRLLTKQKIGLSLCVTEKRLLVQGGKSSSVFTAKKPIIVYCTFMTLWLFCSRDFLLVELGYMQSSNENKLWIHIVFVMCATIERKNAVYVEHT